jgi:hypothetical protein
MNLSGGGLQIVSIDASLHHIDGPLHYGNAVIAHHRAVYKNIYIYTYEGRYALNDRIWLLRVALLLLVLLLLLGGFWPENSS